VFAAGQEEESIGSAEHNCAGGGPDIGKQQAAMHRGFFEKFKGKDSEKDTTTKAHDNGYEAMRALEKITGHNTQYQPGADHQGPEKTAARPVECSIWKEYLIFTTPTLV
jgi:hypothetical protein